MQLRKMKFMEAMERFKGRHGHSRIDEVDDEFSNLECWLHSGLPPLPVTLCKCQ